MRWAKSSSGFVTIGTVFALLATSLAVLFGIGGQRSLFNLGDGFAWLASDDGSLTEVNGATGQAVGGAETDAGSLEVVQRGKWAFVAGKDGKLLYRIGGTATGEKELDETLEIGGDRAYLVRKSGRTREIDPTTLVAIGEPLEFNGAIDARAVDDGRLVVAEQNTTDVFAVEGADRGTPTRIGDPNRDNGQLQVGRVGEAVAVLDPPARKAFVFRPNKPVSGVDLPELPADAVLGEGEGNRVVVYGPEGTKTRIVAVDLETGSIDSKTVDVDPRQVRLHTAQNGLFFLTGDAASVTVVDPATGAVRARVETNLSGGRVTSSVKDGMYYLNDASSDRAVVVDERGHDRRITKFKKRVPDPTPLPPVPTPEQPPLPGPPPDFSQAPPPVANLPSAPPNFTATAGKSKVVLGWGLPSDGGSPIDHYTLTCSPDCGGDRNIDGSVQDFTVEDLKNGTTYTFRLTATNGVGTGPPATATATPIADAPGKVTNVKVEAKADGKVVVSWDSADFGGLSGGKYRITGSSNSSTARLRAITPLSQTGTSYTWTVPEPAYDDDSTPDWEFRITAVAQKDGRDVVGDEVRSDRVDPYDKPAFKPADKLTIEPADGSLTVSWPAAAANGRKVEYLTTCAGCPAVPSTAAITETLTGLTNGQAYDIKIVARNDAASSTPLTLTGTPFGTPIVTITSPRGDSTSQVSFDFTVSSWKGSPGTCESSVGSRAPNSVSCGGHVTHASLSAGTSYTVKVCATNGEGATGCDTATVSTQSPPPKSATISKGGSQTVRGCTTASCRRVHLELRNFSPGSTVGYACYNSSGQYWPTSGTIAIAVDGSGSFSGDLQCVYGMTGTATWVSVGGIESNHLTW